MEKPYVLSGELEFADPALLNLNKLDDFRSNLDLSLRSAGKQPVWVSSNTIRDSFDAIINATSVPVISMDDRYVTNATQYLGISRNVNEELVDEGYQSRAGYPPLEWQLDQIAAEDKEVIVVDDVLFSGEMATWLNEQLAVRRVKIGAFVCGVAIKEGVDRLSALDIPVECAVSFDEVDDEICERDLTFAPGSGRRISTLSSNALYFDPRYGNPTEWASIPENAAEGFFRASLTRALEVLQPAVQLGEIGNFYGYTENENAIQQIINRLEMES